MTHTPLDDLGPVDYAVVEFPAGANNFTGETATELVALVDSGTIRVVDILILTKDEDGSVEAMELSDPGKIGPLQELEAELAKLLAAEDVEHLAAAMDPGSHHGLDPGRRPNDRRKLTCPSEPPEPEESASSARRLPRLPSLLPPSDQDRRRSRRPR